MDLRAAYLQIRVHQFLWPYQTVAVGGRRYCLTRLGLGLNVGPAVMKTVLCKVLSMNPEVARGMSSYVDDIGLHALPALPPAAKKVLQPP